MSASSPGGSTVPYDARGTAPDKVAPEHAPDPGWIRNPRREKLQHFSGEERVNHRCGPGGKQTRWRRRVLVHLSTE